jgi:hypothetical protein
MIEILNNLEEIRKNLDSKDSGYDRIFCHTYVKCAKYCIKRTTYDGQSVPTAGRLVEYLKVVKLKNLIDFVSRSLS